MTGEGWNEIMHDLSKPRFFYSSILDMNCDLQMDIKSKPWSEWDADGDGYVDNPTECGTGFAYIYFISYTIVVTYVILNLFIAVIFEGFEESKSTDTKEIIRVCMDVWEKYDPNNTLYVPLAKCLDFVDETFSIIMARDPGLGRKYRMEDRWDPNYCMDVNLPDGVWSMYKLRYVRSLDLWINGEEEKRVRLVQAVKAVMRRIIIAGGPGGGPGSPHSPETRKRILMELEAFELQLRHDSGTKEIEELKRLQYNQGKLINSSLWPQSHRQSVARKGSALLQTLAGSSSAREDLYPGEYSMLSKVAAAKIQRAAKESLQRRRDMARELEEGDDPEELGSVMGPINRAAG
eukprot:TRINITY_DN24187_c0_g1_i1.p2 TRINITY_DN24187_c0_g1~~TRINITY_DN24187_c0_g1_i1.p2  ORF type:complete len:348 (+),score=70.21 TRINITY_DN24187_c0_g1_i1:1312-2355(+)